jgi:hypothetical protein
LTAVILLLTTMSVFGQAVYEKKDKSAGSTLVFTKPRDANLEGDSFFTERYVMFSFEAKSPVSALVRNPFYIHIDTRTNDWMFIAAGESLQLRIDGGELVALKGMGSIESRNVVSGDAVLESANWEIPLAWIQRIASAKTVEFRILGDRQSATGSLNANFIADARGFAEKAPGLLVITAPKPE